MSPSIHQVEADSNRTEPQIHPDNNDIYNNEQLDCDIESRAEENVRINSSRISRNKPIGVAFFGTFFKFEDVSTKRTFHKTLVLFITFISYTCYHMGRRPLSIVKNVLNRNCSEVPHVTLFDPNEDVIYYQYGPNANEDPNWCDWAPFNDDATANQLLALLDSAFLFSYAICMFFSGFIADRCNIRYFLSAGMILSGLLLYAFGLSFALNIHSMTYFVIVQLLSGAIQTTGWPAMVTSIGSWFDSSSRGAVFGLWNANTNVGNILGATIAGYFVEKNWGLSFIVPGFIMLGVGVLAFLFLVPKPEDVGLLPIKALNDLKQGRQAYEQEDVYDSSTGLPQNVRGNSHQRRKSPNVVREDDSAVFDTDSSQAINNSEISPLISTTPTPGQDTLRDHHISDSPSHAVSFWTCLKIPGVVEYSLCLGFAKLVSYTFLYWLPRYITQSTLNNSEQSAYLSVPFDIGGMFGAIIAGYLSDRYKKSASICTVMLILAMPSMFIYEKYASISNTWNIVLQLITGLLVNGPYALITTAVSADLGSRVKDGKSMATVAAIIDGTGSIGAAIGPLVAGYISDSGWQSVFLLLMASDLIASLCLTRVTLKEIGFR